MYLHLVETTFLEDALSIQSNLHTFSYNVQAPNVTASFLDYIFYVKNSTGTKSHTPSQHVRTFAARLILAGLAAYEFSSGNVHGTWQSSKRIKLSGLNWTRLAVVKRREKKEARLGLRIGHGGHSTISTVMSRALAMLIDTHGWTSWGNVAVTKYPWASMILHETTSKSATRRHFNIINRAI